MVADAQLVVPHVDTLVYVTRQGITNQNMLKLINDQYKTNKIKNVSMVLNGFKIEDAYGYNPEDE